MKRLILSVATAACCSLFLSGNSAAKTLILEGKLDGTVAMQQAVEFAVNKGTVSSFSFRFALPATFNSRTVSQSIDGFQADFSPRPASSNIETDRFGNRFQKVTWQQVDQDIRIKLTYTASIRSELATLTSKAPFPLDGLSDQESGYLKPTELVQSNDAAIHRLARQLTADATNEHQAVMAITNWVADNIKYTFNPPQYDAAYTLTTKSGNCQNFAHLSIALLRSLGIPARIVGGITLKDSWKVPIDARNSIVQSMGQGGHAWLEVWFPDLGWLPYDPQQSKQFTSTRHIKQSHGFDSKDINDTWRGGPYLPAYSETINGRFISDTINLKMKHYDSAPRPYLLSNQIASAGIAKAVDAAVPAVPSRPAAPVIVSKPDTPILKPPASPSTATPVATPVVPVKPPVATPAAPATGAGPVVTRHETADDDDKKPATTKPVGDATPTKPSAAVPPKPLVTAEQVPRKPTPGSRLVFGNMEFPTLVSLYNVKGNTGTRVFERETSEYVTSRHIYAQAFMVKDRMSLDRISLAMRKFGGDGSVYLDLVKDAGNKPDIMQGIRSNLVDLEKIPRHKPGYYWVDFSFPPEGNRPHQLLPGKYWIVLRASGEAIMNWFFIPGKPYSGGDDTRSTAKGFQWEDILNYDFVFKVDGRTL
jgi:transglutaminase-like putative cysteine protease